MKSAAVILTLLFLVVSLIIGVILVFVPKKDDMAIKLFGSIVVVGLSLASNDVWVYALAIFIIATLVTELSFLENIAAIFWNREKYWEYMMKKASVSELKAKRQEEALEEQGETASGTEPSEPETAETTTPQETTSTDQEAPKDQSLTERQVRIDAISSSERFEHAVLLALKDGFRPYISGKLFKQMKVVASDGTEMIYDAIINTHPVDYIIEIKKYQRPSSLYNVLSQLRGSVSYYQNYLAERGITKRIVPIVVVPSDLNAPSIFKDSLAVLKFDEATRRFTNMNEFITAVNHLISIGSTGTR